MKKTISLFAILLTAFVLTACRGFPSAEEAIQAASEAAEEAEKAAEAAAAAVEAEIQASAEEGKKAAEAAVEAEEASLNSQTAQTAKPIRNGYDWNRLPSSERLKYAETVKNTVHALYPASAIKECLDELYRYGESEVMRVPVSDSATVCHTLISNGV